MDEKGYCSSTWYNKPTDTGLVLNYHALAPRRYKRSVVSSFVHRIVRASSSWENVHKSLEKAKKVLERNQYPPSFYDPIIENTLSAIVHKSDQKISDPNFSPTSLQAEKNPTSSIPAKMIFVQYRGKCTEDYARALHRCNAPCRIVMTLRKLKTTMPSLKPPVEKKLRSGAVYRIQCPGCNACYVGQTDRHISVRFNEHTHPAKPVKQHFEACKEPLLFENLEVLKTSSKGESHLLTLEALFIEELQPSINTKDEYRSRALTIRLY